MMTEQKLRKKLMTESRCSRGVINEVLWDCDLEDWISAPDQFEDIRNTLIDDCRVWSEQIERLKRALEKIETYEQLMEEAK